MPVLHAVAACSLMFRHESEVLNKSALCMYHWLSFLSPSIKNWELHVDKAGPVPASRRDASLALVPYNQPKYNQHEVILKVVILKKS